MLRKKLKIGIVSEMYLPRIGGLELHVRDLARELNQRGHETHIITNTPGPHSYDDGVKLFRLDLPRVPILHILRTPKASDSLQRIFEKQKYDIIHTHNAFLPLAHMANFVANHLRLPTVLTECSWLGAGWLRFFRGFHRLSDWGNWPTLLSGVSRCVADQLAAISGRKDVFILHNGVRVESWKTEHQEPARPVVVSVMRFTKRKRPIDIVRAIPRVHEKLPEPLRPRFLLIGDGRERQRIVREAKRLGVLSHLELPGFLDRQDIRRRFAESSLFALPTEREAMSLVCVEALSAGLPVIAMNMGGVSDVVAHGEEGYLCGSAEEFADGIVRVVADTALRNKLAAAAPRRVQRFSWDGIIDRHLNVFELAIAKVRGERSPLLTRLGTVDTEGLVE